MKKVIPSKDSPAAHSVSVKSQYASELGGNATAKQNDTQSAFASFRAESVKRFITVVVEKRSNFLIDQLDQIESSVF